MQNKKLFITILVIIIVIGGFAFVAYRNAQLQKSLGHQASFREFLGLGDKKPAQDGSGNTLLSSLFTNPSATQNSTTSSNGFNPLVSIFTSSTSTVNTQSGDSGDISDNNNTSWTINNNIVNANNLTCSDVDLNIPFTAAEQAQLAVLNTRFGALYQQLYSDDNVADEQSIYDGMALELAKIKELRNYCESVESSFTGYYAVHLPTPFWSDSKLDKKNSSGGATNTGGFLTNGTQGAPTYNIDGSFAQYNGIEDNLKLHIW
ncbi:MAG: hypothetical protein WCQ32_00160 [bacterium]